MYQVFVKIKIELFIQDIKIPLQLVFKATWSGTELKNINHGES